MTAASRLEVAFTADPGRGTFLRHLFQETPLRACFPLERETGLPSAVLVTTSGGMVAGDHFRIDIAADSEASALVTTQAAEKIYRSTGERTCTLSARVTVGAGAWLEWMPQETILFDGARLRRTTRAEVARGARLLTGEIVILGRTARGERFTHGCLFDRWEIRRDGRLVWTDALALDGDLPALLARADTFDGAVAVATLIYVADDAERHLSRARDLVAAAETDKVLSGCTVVGGLLVVRWLGHDARGVRLGFAAFWAAFRKEAGDSLPAAVPRIWTV